MYYKFREDKELFTKRVNESKSVKEILNSMALLSGLAYAVYYFWKVRLSKSFKITIPKKSLI